MTIVKDTTRQKSTDWKLMPASMLLLSMRDKVLSVKKMGWQRLLKKKGRTSRDNSPKKRGIKYRR